MKIICSNCQTENDENSKYCSICGYKLAILENQNKQNAVEDLKVENKKKKFDLKTFIGFVIGFIVMFFITQSFFKPSMNIDKEIVKSVNEINKVCPIRVDEYMTLDNVMALPNKTIQYNYSLVEIEKAEVNLDTVKKYVFGSVLENIKTNPDMQLQRENNVTFNYYYKDKKGAFVTKYIVTPEMYK